MDFLDSLKSIKEQMKKEAKEDFQKPNLKSSSKPEKKEKNTEILENKKEEINEFESIADRENRLRDEFEAYILNEDIKKI